MARFKDTYRQATTDLMLGNHVSAESLTAFGNQSVQDEFEGVESAEHAKLLIEDCRKILLGSTQCPLGAWGLIDGNPKTGDLNETEVDTILLLTEDYYIVAEYESNLDKIVKFEKVFLDQIVLVEFGNYQYKNLESHLCIRIYYKNANNEECIHMFRSSNLRFFNNVAFVIRTKDEVADSLSAIVECFRITLNSSGKSNIPFHIGITLQLNNQNLDSSVSTRKNLSDKQLVQAGSKAISNMAEQISRFGQKFNQNNKSEILKEKCNNVDNYEAKQSESVEHNSSNTCSDLNSVESNNFDQVKINNDRVYNDNYFLPSVGIVMSGDKDQINSYSSALQTNDAGTISKAPEIRINNITGNNTTELLHVESQKLSSSASSITDALTRNNPQMILNLAGSQSDNALKQLKTLTSPLTKFAKNVQTFGINLDPRKITARPGVSASISADLSLINNQSSNEKNILIELWKDKNCKTKLIAL